MTICCLLVSCEPSPFGCAVSKRMEVSCWKANGRTKSCATHATRSAQMMSTSRSLIRLSREHDHEQCTVHVSHVTASTEVAGPGLGQRGKDNVRVLTWGYTAGLGNICSESGKGSRSGLRWIEGRSGRPQAHGQTRLRPRHQVSGEGDARPGLHGAVDKARHVEGQRRGLSEAGCAEKAAQPRNAQAPCPGLSRTMQAGSPSGGGAASRPFSAALQCMITRYLVCTASEP